MRKRVLLVEDNVANVEVMKKELEWVDYEVMVAKNGEEAVEMAGTYLPDLIVMDIHMPGMDGLEAAYRIRQRENNRHIPILACTAKATSGDKERCLNSGCDDYLAKPFTHRELRVVTERLLQKSRERLHSSNDKRNY